MKKYQTEFKLKVVSSFLAGDGGAKLLARQWSVPEEKIRTWVSHYRLHGIDGLRPGGARPPPEVLRSFIDQHRNAFGVEPLCKILQVAPSAYRRHSALLRQPHKRCARAKRDELLMPQIQRV